MEKLSNMCNFLKYGNMNFDASKSFKEIIKEISEYDVYSSDLYISKQLEVQKRTKSTSNLSFSGTSNKLSSIKNLKNIKELNLNTNLNSVNKIDNIKESNKEKFYKCIDKEREDLMFKMKKETEKAQNFLSVQKNYDLQNNPKEVIDALEKQFKLEKMLGISSENENQKYSLTRKNNKKISNYFKNEEKKDEDISNFELKINHPLQKDKGITKKVLEKEFRDNVVYDDIEDIKKKNRLLEYVLLIRARNSYLLKNEKNEKDQETNLPNI